MNKKIKLTLALSFLTGIVSFAHAELSSIQKQAIADQQTMVNMSAQEKRAFRETVFSQYGNQQQLEYNQAFKKAVRSKRNSISVAPTAINLSNSAVRVPGTSIIYDTGIASGTTVAGFGARGNIYDSAFKPGSGIVPVETTGTITGVTIGLEPHTAAVTAWVQVVTDLGGSVNLANSMGFGPIPINTAAALFAFDYSGTMTVMHANGAFVVGLNSSSGVPPAFDSNSLSAQGFQAVGFNTTMFTDASSVTAIPALNAIIRVKGDVLTPVELMNFSIE